MEISPPQSPSKYQLPSRQARISAVPAHRDQVAMRGLRLKQLVLLTGAVYFSLVAVTNVGDLTSVIGRFHWTFLNSGNAGYIVSVTKAYNCA